VAALAANGNAVTYFQRKWKYRKTLPGTALAKSEKNPLCLGTLDQATRMLAESRTLPEVKKIKDLAEAARVYARAAHLGQEAQNYAAEIGVRAQRKAGKILKQLEKSNGDPADCVSGGSEYRQTLDETQTNERTAQRWQELAEVDDGPFEDYLQRQKDNSKEISASGLLREKKAENRCQKQCSADRSDTLRDLREWMRTIHPTITAVVQGSMYRVQARSQNPDAPETFDIQFRTLTVDQVKAACKVLSEFRQVSPKEYEYVDKFI